jgi:cardiolipin synthase
MVQEWDKEQIFFSGDDYFAEVIKAINAAAKTVIFETYIYDKGVVGDRVAEALINAARRGIRVKILVDGIGSPGFAKAYFSRLRSNGIGVRFFRVLPWMIGRYPGDSRRWYWRLSQRLRHFNQGNHRKLCLIDDKTLFIGSFNVSDVHLREVKGEGVWKDIGACVEGPETKFVRRAFYRAYRHFHVPSWGIRTPKLIMMNDSFVHKRSNKIKKVQRMKAAMHRILLQTPYFVPPGYILRGLVRKAKRGITVKLIVPRSSDVWVVQWMSLGILHYLAKKGVEVYFYTLTFNHQKVFIIDDWMCLGSTNLNHRSFLHDLEMDVVITHSENKLKMEQSFQADLDNSIRYDPARWHEIPLFVRLVGNFLRLARYWA